MRRLFPVTLAAGLVLAVAIPALAATSVTKFDVGLTAKKEAASSGLTFDIAFGSDPEPKPEGLQRFALTLPKGAKFDLRAKARCSATPADVEREGSAACPSRTQVGQGTATATSDGANAITANVKIFNLTPRPRPSRRSDGQLLFTFDVGSATAAAFDATVRGRTMTSAALTGELPGEFVVTKFEGRLARAQRGGRRLVTTPRNCPRSRRWTLRGTFRFPSGTSRPRSTTPCRR